MEEGGKKTSVYCAQQAEENLPFKLETLQKAHKKLQEETFGNGMIKGNNDPTKFYLCNRPSSCSEVRGHLQVTESYCEYYFNYC